MNNERRHIEIDPNLTPQQAMAQYQSWREKADSLPQIEVPRQEFIRLLIASGECPEKAEQMTAIAEALGSHVMIGEQMVGVKKQ